jgi:hypothetical protein
MSHGKICLILYAVCDKYDDDFIGTSKVAKSTLPQPRRCTLGDRELDSFLVCGIAISVPRRLRMNHEYGTDLEPRHLGSEVEVYQG